MEVETRTQIVCLAAPNHHTFQRVVLALGQILEQGQLNDVTRTIVRHLERSIFLDLLAIVAIDVIQKGLAFV